METERTKKIIGAINKWQLYLVGLGERPQERLDPPLTLLQLFDANAAVRDWLWLQKVIGNTVPEWEGHISPLEDRLLAAVYVLLEYGPDKRPFCMVNGKGLLCLDIRIRPGRP